MILYDSKGNEVNLQEKISRYDIGSYFILRKNSMYNFEGFYPINFRTNKRIESKVTLYFDDIQYEVTAEIYVTSGSLKINVEHGDTQGEIDKVATLVLNKNVILD